MRRGRTPHPLTVLVAATVSLAGVLSSALPAAAQTAATRGALFDGIEDTTLPTPSPLNQLFTSANDGWVHFPFSAADLRPLLRSSTFNGTADTLRRGRRTVATGFFVDGYDGETVWTEGLSFGLSPSRDASQCDFDAVGRTAGIEPDMLGEKALATETYLIGSPRDAGSKLGYVRLPPDPFLTGKYLCVQRSIRVFDINNPPYLYDDQVSPTAISSVPIDIDFTGSRYTPETVAEVDPEPAEADEPQAEQEADPEGREAEDEAEGREAEDEAADAAADEDVDVEESTTSADPEATDTDPAADDPAADGGDTDGAEATEQPTVATPTETAPAPAPEDDAVTAAASEDVTAAPDDVADDDGGSGALVPTLAGLIGVLLAGIALVLARRRRRDDGAAESTSAPADAARSDLGVADEGGAEGDAEAP